MCADMAWLGRTIIVFVWLMSPALLLAQTPRVQLPTTGAADQRDGPEHMEFSCAVFGITALPDIALPQQHADPNNVYPPGTTVTPAPSSVPFDPYSTAPGAYGGQAPPFNPTQPYGGGQAPYYQQGLSGPDSLYPNGMPFNEPSWNMPQVQEFTKLLQRIRFSQSWIAGGDDPTDVGVYDTEVSATFDVPLFGLQDHFLFTPGFALHLWQGPFGSTGADLPGNTYDAYLDTGWNPKFTNYFSAELGVRVGAYTILIHFHRIAFVLWEGDWAS